MVARSATGRKRRTTQARRHAVALSGHTYDVIITPAAEAGLLRDLIQVSSKSEPDGLRTVTLSEAGDRPVKCTCDGWAWRGDCNHLRAVREALSREAAAAEPAPAPEGALPDGALAWRMEVIESGPGFARFRPAEGLHAHHTVTLRHSTLEGSPYWEAARCTCTAYYEWAVDGQRHGDASLASGRYVWLADVRPDTERASAPRQRRSGRDFL